MNSGANEVIEQYHLTPIYIDFYNRFVRAALFPTKSVDGQTILSLDFAYIASLLY